VTLLEHVTVLDVILSGTLKFIIIIIGCWHTHDIRMGPFIFAYI